MEVGITISMMKENVPVYTISFRIRSNFYVGRSNHRKSWSMEKDCLLSPSFFPPLSLSLQPSASSIHLTKRKREKERFSL